MATRFTTDDVAHIAKLANIPVTQEEKEKLASGFTTTLGVVEQLNEVDVKNVKLSHTSGLVNVFREDEVDETRQFTQEQALANAALTHEGYIIVDQVIEQED
jgi:aspartyl/glutamyl-tRNA(Asn/Gln) amidotransferase C subunit